MNNLYDTQDDLTPSASMPRLGRLSKNAPRKPLKANDWLSLAVVALAASDHACSDGNSHAAQRYCEIARTCDGAAEILPFASANAETTLTADDWIALGVLALHAADQAREEGSFHAEQRYCEIASKCDHAAERAPRTRRARETMFR